MLTEDNHAARTATEVWSDARGRSQKHFVDQVCNDMLDGVRAYPRVPGELPKHDIVMTTEGPDALLERFKREPDMLASFLPEGFAVIELRHLDKLLEMLSGAIPMPTSPFAKALGPVDGKSMAEYLLRVSADRLYGVSEQARRQHEDEQR